ncbi:MAG: hypothetical protein K6L73_13250 [Cellvibrionaceae bacterium]
MNTLERSFPSRFFSYQHLMVPTCRDVPLKKLVDLPVVKFQRRRHRDELSELAYKSYIHGYSADDEEEQLAKTPGPGGFVEINEGNIIEVREDIKQIPDVAIQVDGGWLAGSDRGEWDGELMYIPDDGKTVKLLSDNVTDLYLFGDHYIALAGLVHITMNRGSIYSIKRSDNAWYVGNWISLPGAPKSSWLVETGELLINTYDAGSILLSESGGMRMAPCEEYEEFRH